MKRSLLNQSSAEGLLMPKAAPRHTWQHEELRQYQKSLMHMQVVIYLSILQPQPSLNMSLISPRGLQSMYPDWEQSGEGLSELLPIAPLLRHQARCIT